jgi:hypothetical protein
VYPAEHILLKGETPAQCVARKERAVVVAKRLRDKAAAPSLAGYWQDVTERLLAEAARVEAELCRS